MGDGQVAILALGIAAIGFASDLLGKSVTFLCYSLDPLNQLKGLIDLPHLSVSASADLTGHSRNFAGCSTEPLAGFEHLLCSPVDFI